MLLVGESKTGGETVMNKIRYTHSNAKANEGEAGLSPEIDDTGGLGNGGNTGLLESVTRAWVFSTEGGTSLRRGGD